MSPAGRAATLLMLLSSAALRSSALRQSHFTPRFSYVRVGWGRRSVSATPSRPMARRRQVPVASTMLREVNGRLDADELTLDPQLVAKNPEVVISHLRARRSSEENFEAVHRIGQLMGDRSKLIHAKDGALSARKTMSAQIGALMKAGQADKATELKQQVEESNAAADAAEASLRGVDEMLSSLMLRLPNLLDSAVPDGTGEADNEVVSEWGSELIRGGADWPWHDDIATRLGGWDADGAARIAGARFVVLMGPLARLERALGQWFLDVHTWENGYKEASVPHLVTRSVLEGTGQLPKFEDDLFKTNHRVAGEDSFLIPTAEVPLTSLVRGRLLEESSLPLSYVALTPCFRAEAGSYGRDTRGLLRQHQFYKCELVKICTPATSAAEHERMTAHAEGILRALRLPYRRLRLCSGDIGFGASLCYDLEVWLPGQQAYREISSVSNCRDFQSRRMGLRYREAASRGGTDGGGGGEGGRSKANKPKTSLCHTLNGSGVAVGRALVAVLENYYDPEDGGVVVPEVLRPYMGGLTKLMPPQ